MEELSKLHSSRVEMLEGALKDCADDLENYVSHEHQFRDDYPHIMAKWERDMEPVNKARAALALTTVAKPDV